jgi:ubiquitin-protein ligase
MAGRSLSDGVSEVDVRDRNGVEIARLELSLAEATPADILDHLRSEQRIMDRDPQSGQQMLSWLAFDQRQLVADLPLAEQGVGPGAVLSVEYRHVKGADRSRLERERALLADLAAGSNGRIEVSPSPDLHQFTVTLHVRGPVAGRQVDYVICDRHTLTVTIPDDYPASPPLLRLAQPVLVPNCWADGRPCLLGPGEDPWKPARILAGVVREVVEMIQGGGQNGQSIANHAAHKLWKRSRARIEADIGAIYVPPAVNPSQRTRTLSTRPAIRSMGRAPHEPEQPAPRGIRTI